MDKNYDLSNYLNMYWCHDKFGICYPLLKKVDITVPISQQKGYNDEYGRYWTKPVLVINNNHYIICSQWYEEFRENLEKWISENPLTTPSTYLEHNQLLGQLCLWKQLQEQKLEVHVLPKAQTKVCLKCKAKTAKEIIDVEYHTASGVIKNKLFTRKCINCNINYIADTIFKSYTRSKDIENINVTFKT